MKNLALIFIFIVIVVAGFTVYDKLTNRFDQEEAISLFNKKINQEEIFFIELVDWIKNNSQYQEKSFAVSSIRDKQTIFIEYEDQSEWSVVDNRTGTNFYHKFKNLQIRSLSVSREGTITIFFEHRDQDLNWYKLVTNEAQTTSNKWYHKVSDTWFLTK